MSFSYDIQPCLNVLNNGGIILYPTDTVWGIGCDAGNEEAVEKIVSETAVNEIHFSAVTYRESAMQYRNQAIAGMGSDEGAEFKYRTVDPDRVRAIRKLAEGAKKM